MTRRWGYERGICAWALLRRVGVSGPRVEHQPCKSHVSRCSWRRRFRSDSKAIQGRFDPFRAIQRRWHFQVRLYFVTNTVRRSVMISHSPVQNSHSPVFNSHSPGIANGAFFPYATSVFADGVRKRFCFCASMEHLQFLAESLYHHLLQKRLPHQKWLVSPTDERLVHVPAGRV